jgi:hypothetical protein
MKIRAMYSMNGCTPGDCLEVDDDHGARLIKLGAAMPYDCPFSDAPNWRDEWWHSFVVAGIRSKQALSVATVDELDELPVKHLGPIRAQALIDWANQKE